MSEDRTERRTVEDRTDGTVDPINKIADEQIRPDDPDYLDGIREFRQAVDIGRRVLKRDRAGGRPSKVERGLDRIESTLEWYGGEQRRRFLINDLQDIHEEMSRPTWRKFVDEATEVIADELDEPMDVSGVVDRGDRF